jgi:hypothetical protein
MLPRRFSVKFFVTDPPHVELSKFVPIFQRWIQRQLVEGMLIDVAAYEHVLEGPGILLIGDEGDYSLDMRDGRPGVMYTRKRQIEGTLPDTLRLATRLALIAAQKLTAEPTIKGITFDTSTVQITLLDRLHMPNTPEAFAAVKSEIEQFAGSLYGTADTSLELAYADPREPLSVIVKAAEQFDLAALVDRLAAGETVTG